MTPLRQLALVTPHLPGGDSLAAAMLEGADTSSSMPDPESVEGDFSLTLHARSSYLEWQGEGLHLLDVPGEAPLRAELERLLTRIDAILIAVDATTGPKPESTYLLESALRHRCRVILALDGFDRAHASTREVFEELFVSAETRGSLVPSGVSTLFVSTEFGYALRDPEETRGDLSPLFETCLEVAEASESEPDHPLCISLASLAPSTEEASSSAELESLVGRIMGGPLAPRESLELRRPDGTREMCTVQQLRAIDTQGQLVEREHLEIGDLAWLELETDAAPASPTAPDETSEIEDDETGASSVPPAPDDGTDAESAREEGPVPQSDDTSDPTSEAAPEAESDEAPVSGDGTGSEDSGPTLESYEPSTKFETSEFAAVEPPDEETPSEHPEDIITEQIRLAETAESPQEAAEHWLEAAVTARDDLEDLERALTYFERGLRADPGRIEAFEAITTMLIQAGDWRRLEEAYRDVIELYRESEQTPRDILGALWHKLGHVYRLHLEQPEKALEAYREAASLTPDRTECREAIVELTTSELDRPEIAERHLRALYRLDRNRLEVLEELGRLYMRLEAIDAALCHLQTYDALGGHLDPRAEDFVGSFETGMYNSPDRALSPHLQRRHLYPETMELSLNEVFRLLFPVLHDWISEFRSEYGLDADDFIERDAPLAINNIYHDIAEHLGYDPAPDLWQHDDYRGLTKAALDEPAVIVGNDILATSDERVGAFAAAKTLFLLQRPFYLLGLRNIVDLEAFFVLALQLVHPDIDLERDEAMEEAYRAMESSITGESRDQLREAIEASTDDSHEVDLLQWSESVEDAANRAGLVFAGDLEVARAYLEREPQSFSERSVDARLLALADYHISDDYLTLRDKLGLAVSKG